MVPPDRWCADPHSIAEMHLGFTLICQDCQKGLGQSEGGLLWTSLLILGPLLTSTFQVDRMEI